MHHSSVQTDTLKGDDFLEFSKYHLGHVAKCYKTMFLDGKGDKSKKIGNEIRGNSLVNDGLISLASKRNLIGHVNNIPIMHQIVLTE